VEVEEGKVEWEVQVAEDLETVVLVQVQVEQVGLVRVDLGAVLLLLQRRRCKRLLLCS